MQHFLIIVALLVFGFGLRSCRTMILRKLGAIAMLFTSGLCFYYISDSVWIGLSAAFSWFLLPWVELLTRIRKMRMPLQNKLSQASATNLNLFPRAEQHIHDLEDEGYEHIRNCSWNIGGVEQHYQLFWNAETKSVASLCLCEQSNVTFTYLTITSRDLTNEVWRTTNFPFSHTLKPSPSVHWNQVSCANECALRLLKNHDRYLNKQGFLDEDLSIPDPDVIEEDIEAELRHQIDHNLQRGIISLSGDGHFHYTLKGLFFLWRQSVRDMIRLC